MGNLLLNATPLGTPLFHRTPSVVGPSPALSWEVADFWTNRLEGFTLARQTKQPVQQNETLAPESWYVRSAGWGWAVIDGKTVATVEDFLYSCSYPTMGVNAWLTNGLAISAETTLTIEYSIKRFDSGVSLYLTPSDADGNPMAFDADGITPSLKIATLTGGNSTAEWTTGTLTLTGTGALTPLVGQTGVQLIFYFADSTGAGSSLYGGGTEVFRIDSTALSGTAEDWVTAETVSVSAAQRAHTFSHLTEETHRLILTAEYAGETNFSSTLLLPVSVSNEPPGIVCVETSNALVYTISGADDFTYAFRTQNNSLDGTATRSGNTVTYAFPAAITNYGTHWITLAVTNSATGFGTRDYHVLNLPVESSLRPHTEFTLSNAVERAAAEGKNVLLFSLAKPDAPSLYGIRDVLANAAVLNALTNYFILWEHGALHAEEQSLTESYWKPQPGQSFGFTGETNCYPSAYGYLFLIAPSSATNQIPGDELPTYYSGTTRWDYDNAQYSLTSPAAVDASNFVRFLSQSFALPVSAFSICDAESGAALTNVAVASAVLDAVRQAAGDSLGDIRQIAIPTAQADALYLFGLAASVHVINQAASASVNYQFSVTNVSLREDNGQIWVQLTAAVHDDEAGGGLAPSVLGRAYLLGKPSMNPDSGDWQPVAETGTSFMDGVVRIPEFDLSSNRFFFIEIRP